MLKVWESTFNTHRACLLQPRVKGDNPKQPILFITTYNKVNLYHYISKCSSKLVRSITTRDISDKEIKVTLKIFFPPYRHSSQGWSTKSKTATAHQGLQQTPYMLTLQWNFSYWQHLRVTYYTVQDGNCNNSNLIYCLEWNLFWIKNVVQTKNRVIDRFKGRIFDEQNQYHSG